MLRLNRKASVTPAGSLAARSPKFKKLSVISGLQTTFVLGRGENFGSNGNLGRLGPIGVIGKEKGERRKEKD